MSNRSIYQKYRPQRFTDIVGQDLVRKVLLNALKNKKVGHAYLFTGPRGTGKTSIARLLAKAVNCLDPQADGDACGKCFACKSIQDSKYIDLIEIDAASNRGIDEIRDLREKVNFAPAEGKKKVYIIDEVHMLTKEAFNALLKTLEEPPEYVIFILATTEAHKVPLTILSRVQRFDLKLASKEELVSKIKFICKSEGVEIDDDASSKIFELSGGSYRDSESLLSKVLSQEHKKDGGITIHEVEDSVGLVSSDVISALSDSLINGDTGKSLGILEKAITSGFGVDQLVIQVLLDLRQKLREAYQGKAEYDLKRLIKVISSVAETAPKLKDAAIVELPIEIMIYNLSKDTNETNSVRLVEPPTVIKKVEKKTVESHEELVKSWSQVIEKSKVFNHNLYAFLTTAVISRIEDDKLYLEVGYKFHKQKIESIKARKILSDIFKEVFGNNYVVECIINPALIKHEEEKHDNMSNEDIVEEIFSDI